MSILTSKRAQLDDKLLANKVFTDLSEFELDNNENDSDTMLSLLEHIRDKLSESECSNIGSIKWNKSFLDKITSKVVAPKIKHTFERIEEQLITNNETSEKFPNHFTYCLLCRHVYTCGDEAINDVALNFETQDICASQKDTSQKQDGKEETVQLPKIEVKSGVTQQREEAVNVTLRSRIDLKL